MEQVLQEPVEDDTIEMPEVVEDFLGLNPWERLFDSDGEWNGGYRRKPRFLGND